MHSQLFNSDNLFLENCIYRSSGDQLEMLYAL